MKLWGRDSSSPRTNFHVNVRDNHFVFVFEEWKVERRAKVYGLVDNLCGCARLVMKLGLQDSSSEHSNSHVDVKENYCIFFV